MPSHAIALTMPSIHSGLFRAASVSSIRRTKTPPSCRANAQLKSTDLALPTWNMPVGDGANRALTSEPVLVTTGESRPVARQPWGRCPGVQPSLLLCPTARLPVANPSRMTYRPSHEHRQHHQRHCAERRHSPAQPEVL